MNVFNVGTPEELSFRAKEFQKTYFGLSFGEMLYDF